MWKKCLIVQDLPRFLKSDPEMSLNNNKKDGLTMSEECTHDCSSCSANCSSRDNGIPKESLNELSSVKKVIGIVSGKGGVGKSLVTALSAVELQRRGYRTAVLDADITGPSIPKLFGIHDKAEGTQDGLFPAITEKGTQIMSINLLLDSETDPVVWRGPVIAGVVKQFWSDVIWSDVDYMFVDMPPGTGDVPLTVFQSLPVDGIIVVTSPQELVEMIVEKASAMAKIMNVPILGLVENMSYFECPDCGNKHYIFGESKAESVANKNRIDTYASIPLRPEVTKACDGGRIEDVKFEELDGLMTMLENL